MAGRASARAVRRGAFLGGMVPFVAATRWPGEIVLFLLFVVGLGVPLALFVLLVRTQTMSIVGASRWRPSLWCFRYPAIPSSSAECRSWGFVLLLLPVAVAGVWLVAWLVDLLVRTDRRLGDQGRLPPPATTVALRPPPRPPVVRGVAVVPHLRLSPEITVKYLRPDEADGDGGATAVVDSPTRPHRVVIDGDVIHQADHPLT